MKLVRLIASSLQIETTESDELEITTLSRDTSVVTPAKPPAIFLTCNELFLKGQTPRPGVNCIHTVVSQGNDFYNIGMLSLD